MKRLIDMLIEWDSANVAWAMFWAVMVVASFLGGIVGNILYQVFMAGFCK